MQYKVESENSKIIEERKEFDQDMIKCLVEAFNGNELCSGEQLSDWLCGEQLQNQYSNQQRIRIIEAFVIEIFQAINFSDNGLFLIKKGQQNIIQGILGYRIVEDRQNLKVCYEKVFAYLNENVYFYQNLDKFDPNIIERCNEQEEVIDQAYDEHVQVKKYIYLSSIGVSPLFQGRGIAQQMINQLLKVQNQMKLNIYLDCSQNTLKLYQKNGFQVIYQHIFKDKFCQKFDRILTYYIMVKVYDQSE